MERVFWLQEDIEYLKANYPGVSIFEVAKTLNRSYSSVGCMVSKLGLRKIKDIHIGQIFTYLTVIEKSANKNANGLSLYICKCKCGNITEVTGVCLNRGDTKSCGCIHVESMKKRRHPPGEVSFNHLYTRLKNNSKNRKGNKAVCSLTYEELKFIVVQDCCYCGAKPKMFNKYLKLDGTREAGNAMRIHQDTVDRATIFVNTVDRVDSSKGYIKDNCVSACWDCNQLKNDFGVEKFLEIVKRIYLFQENKKYK